MIFLFVTFCKLPPASINIMSNYNTSGLEPGMLHIFETLPGNFLILSRELYILTASNHYLRLTGKNREEIRGKFLFDEFPERLPWSEQNGGMRESLNAVLSTSAANQIPLTRIDLPDPAHNNHLRPRWWRTSNTPVVINGAIAYIIHQTEDVTAQVLNELQLMDLNEELAQSNEELQAATEEAVTANDALNKINDELEIIIAERTRELAKSARTLQRVVATTPIGLTIFRGRDFVIEMANQPVLDIWGRTREQSVGKKLMDVFPELDGQPFPKMLNQVLNTGETVALSEIPVDVNQPGGTIKKFYVDFSYDALYDDDGQPDAVLVSVKDITELAESRHMLQDRQEELEAMNEELAASNEEITSTMEELSSANGQLAQTKDRLQQVIAELKISEARKDEFLSIASHELRTPLTGIKAYNQLLQRTLESEKSKDLAAKEEVQVHRLEKLINDLLDVSRINAGKIIYSTEEFEFDAMIRDSAEIAHHTYPKAEIIIEQNDPVTYSGDKVRLEQVMQNLLSNAVKYSPDSERVIIRSKQDGDNIVVSVTDFGIGIHQEHVDKLFDRYYRVDHTAMRFGGLGLGLFISAEILSRHNGKFWIESEPGKGSTFYFSLPMA